MPDSYYNNECVVAMKKVWPEHLWEGATLVIWKESRGNPSSYNKAGYYGCFQVDTGELEALSNVTRAYAKYKASEARGFSGWRPWPPVKGILWE